MRDAELLLAASGLAVSKMHFLIMQNCSQFKKCRCLVLKKSIFNVVFDHHVSEYYIYVKIVATTNA